jgi:hypothetical protein
MSRLTKDKPLSIDSVKATLAMRPVINQTAQYISEKKYDLDRLNYRAEQLIRFRQMKDR